MKEQLKEGVFKLGQKYLADKGFDPGPIDGMPGPMTQAALVNYQRSLTNNDSNRDAGNTQSPFPKDNYSALVSYYGRPGDEHLVTFDFPYPMRIAWEKDRIVTTTRVHALVAPSLGKILEEVQEYFGTHEALQAYGLDLFGGCYNYRPMRGGDKYSRHSWGIAIDLDPDHNGLWTKRKAARMPEGVIDIFEKHGWKSGGRAWGRDFMHFQATR